MQATWLKTPTERGWYWYTEANQITIVQVFPRPGHEYLVVQDDTNDVTGKRQFLQVGRLPGMWHGPITPPNPPL